MLRIQKVQYDKIAKYTHLGFNHGVGIGIRCEALAEEVPLEYSARKEKICLKL